MRAEAIGMRLQRGQQLGFLLLGRVTRPVVSANGAASALPGPKPASGIARRRNRLPARRLRRKALNQALSRLMGLLECQSRPGPEHERNGWNRSGVAHRQHRRRPRLHVQALAATDAQRLHRIAQGIGQVAQHGVRSLIGSSDSASATTRGEPSDSERA
jgi:hypothetical protein